MKLAKNLTTLPRRSSVVSIDRACGSVSRSYRSHGWQGEPCRLAMKLLHVYNMASGRCGNAELPSCLRVRSHEDCRCNPLGRPGSHQGSKQADIPFGCDCLIRGVMFRQRVH